jgi:hypothetical protein
MEFQTGPDPGLCNSGNISSRVPESAGPIISQDISGSLCLFLSEVFGPPEWALPIPLSPAKEDEVTLAKQILRGMFLVSTININVEAPSRNSQFQHEDILLLLGGEDDCPQGSVGCQPLASKREIKTCVTIGVQTQPQISMSHELKRHLCNRICLSKVSQLERRKKASQPACGSFQLGPF